MNIKEFSKITRLSAHTLRFYEKIGILMGVQRNSSGHRIFTEKEIAWAEFVNRLKDTGMPLEKIKEYASLREQGNSTANARMELLLQHALDVEKKIENEKKHLDKIKEKIKFYERMINE